MLIKTSIVDSMSSCLKKTFKSFSTENSVKRGNVFVKSTSKNIFCTLMDLKDKKVKTSCSLRVPEYQNEFNERVSLFKRGILLGQLFGDKIIELGYTEVYIYLDCGINKGRKGVVKGMGQKTIKISFIQLLKGYPHNGCRPAKLRRKKVRTKHKT